jgi:zinc and cadmium transporter
MTTAIFLAAFAIMLASLAGVVVVWIGIGGWIEENLGYLTSFAAGVFLIVSGLLILHTFEAAGSIQLTALYVLAGILLMLILFTLLPLFHHHHQRTSDHDHHQLDIRRILFGDALHNVGDGLLLAIAFSASSATGAIAATGVFFHELVQETSEFFVLRQSGLSTKQALVRNFLVSSTILIGVGIGLTATSLAQSLVPVLLGATAGSFLVVVSHDLIPHSVRASRGNRDWLAHLGWFLFGVGLMLAIMLIIGESH